MASELQSANIRPLVLNLSDSGLPQPGVSAPYAVSSLPSDDHETMDASLLMSPEYVQPLVPTELSDLVTHVFQPESISYLRHYTAIKLARWRKSSVSSTSPIPRSLSLGAPPQSSSMFGLNTQVATPPIGATGTFALARIADHTQREERLAQMRLSRWASDLQRSLANERARFEALARGERAVWLTERLGECVHDGTLVPISELRNPAHAAQAGGYMVKREAYPRRFGGTGRAVDRNDPLGLLRLNEEVRGMAWAAVRIVGGCGAVGALAFWALKTWRGEESVGWGSLGNYW